MAHMFFCTTPSEMSNALEMNEQNFIFWIA